MVRRRAQVSTLLIPWLLLGAKAGCRSMHPPTTRLLEKRRWPYITMVTMGVRVVHSYGAY